MKHLFIALMLVCVSACQHSNGSSHNKHSETPNTKQGEIDDNLLAQFEAVNVVKMHIFSNDQPEPNPAIYPYSGKMITGNLLQLLGEEIQPNNIGQTYACYYIENSRYFILRTTDTVSSNKIVLAIWDTDTGKLKKEIDLAHLYCMKDLCFQQDAWLADLDDSRSLELIIRNKNKDGSESFDVLTDDGNGQFVKASEQLASLAVKENYVMQNNE